MLNGALRRRLEVQSGENVASQAVPQSSSSLAQDADIGVALIARRPFAAGEDVIVFDEATDMRGAADQTLQVGQDRYIESDRIPLLSHSCDPNLRVDTERLAMVALKPIAAGEPLTFFVPEVEWELATPFDCHCGAANCLGRIAGAVDLAAEQRRGHRFSAHIEARFAERDRPAA